MGTPDFAVPVLEALAKEHNIVAVYTRAPKESGRGKKVNKTPVHLLAEAKDIEVRTPKSLRNEDEQLSLKALGADMAIVAAYGLILPQTVLDIFPKDVLTSMLLCCRAGAGRHRYSGQLKPETRKAAFPSCKWRRRLMPATFSARKRLLLHPK